MSVLTEYFFTMDTFAESTVITKKAEDGKTANQEIQKICEEIEGRISNTIKTSEIYQFNSKLEISGTRDFQFDFSEKTSDLLNLAEYMKDKTGGAFNPMLGEIIDLWGINNHDENFLRKLPEKDYFYSALEKVQNGIPSKIDLGAIGKGYAVDEISAYLADNGIPNALVSFSSSVLAAGRNKSGNLWSVGIKDPKNPDTTCGVLNASDKVISVSGGYERFATINNTDYVHIIDPATGYPVDNDLLCIVVVMNAPSALQTKEEREKFKNNGAISDALSTALYVMGKEKALKFYTAYSLDFEMILFVKDESPRGYDIIPTSVMFTEFK